MIERYLIGHCAPALAGIKTANLFDMKVASEEVLNAQIDQWNTWLMPRGLTLRCLRYRNQKALVYAYRRSRLETDLSHPETAEFMKRFGYEQTDPDYAISRLAKRIREEDEFPHEIGLFLGYPLGDVIGFIENAGQNCKCCGCWKVYCNECEAVKLFAQYRKCREVYMRLWSQGRSVLQMCRCC